MFKKNFKLLRMLKTVMYKKTVLWWI